MQLLSCCCCFFFVVVVFFFFVLFFFLFCFVFLKKSVSYIAKQCMSLRVFPYVEDWKLLPSQNGLRFECYYLFALIYSYLKML